MSNNGKSKSKAGKTKGCNENDNKKCEDNLGLASISYADYVILASTLAYALFQEMERDDLAMLITLMYLVISDLQVLIAQDGIIQANCGNQNSSVDENADLEFEEDIELNALSLNRKNKVKKRSSYRKKKKYSKK